MEPKTQDKVKEKVKELKRENRRLKEELDKVKYAFEVCDKEFNNVVRYNAMLEKTIMDLVALHYKDKVKINFDTFELCINQKCIKFDDHEELLTSLRILPLLVQ